MTKWLSREFGILLFAAIDVGTAWFVSWVCAVDFWQMLLIAVLFTANRALYRATP